MFGRRPDATLVPDLAPMRRIMPYISPRRNDSVFHLAQEFEVEAALEFVEKHNRDRPPDRPATLFHLFLRGLSQGFALRPAVNRFVKGGRLWQRRGIYLTFSAKREIADGSPLLTVKRRFEPSTETLDEMIDAIYDRLQPARRGVQSTSDKETKLLLRLPHVVTGALVRAADGLDALGLLPGAMVESDPLYTSIFVANLGSVGHDAGFHHLWEHGTCSVFCVIGKIQPGPDGRRRLRVCWTYDERIEDGLYSFGYTSSLQHRIENPELLLASPEELARHEAQGGRGGRS